jgi:hypothetical protein
MNKFLFPVTLASVLVGTSAIARADTVPAVPALKGFSQWGAITTLQGSVANAALHTVSTHTSSSTSGPPNLRTAVSSTAALANLPSKLHFTVPAKLMESPATAPQPGQAIFISAAGIGSTPTIAFIKFPITLPTTTTCTAHASKTLIDQSPGCFNVITSNLTVSNTGLINGTTEVFSTDDFQGFQGAVAVRLLDINGNLLAPEVQEGCWGVNPRTGVTHTWNQQVDPSIALQTVYVRLDQYSTSCGTDKAAAFFAELSAAATAAGPVITAIAAI